MMARIYLDIISISNILYNIKEARVSLVYLTIDILKVGFKR